MRSTLTLMTSSHPQTARTSRARIRQVAFTLDRETVVRTPGISVPG
jgi:hypothetical protein